MPDSLFSRGSALSGGFHISSYLQYAEEDIFMSNTTVIDYEDSDGKGTVTLVANPFGKGGK